MSSVVGIFYHRAPTVRSLYRSNATSALASGDGNNAEFIFACQLIYFNARPSAHRLKFQIQTASVTIFHADEAPAKERGWKQLGCC